jgi:autotransporter-associated beta strand protein
MAALELQGGIAVANSLTLNGTGVSNAGALRSISGNNTFTGAITLASTGVRINSDAGVFSLTATNTITGSNTNLTFGGLGEIIVSGVIGTGSGTLTKDGSGKLTLSGSNNYTGLTTVSAGVLNVQNNTALGTTAAGVIVSATNAALELQGGVVIGAEALTLNGTGLSSAGALRNVSGNNEYGGAITLGSTGVRINSDAGVLSLTATNTVVGSGFGLTIGGAGDVSVAGGIGTAAGTLTKDGTGTLTLRGVNTYTGVTTLSGGVLMLGATEVLANTSNINFNGGSLNTGGFTETVGTISISSDDGSLFLGSGVHTLTFSGVGTINTKKVKV